MQIFLICILIKQQKHVAINNYLITYFTKQTLNLNYLLLTFNVTVQLLNYPKQKKTILFLNFKHTLFLFFASFRKSKSALCHLLCEATCSLRTDKQLRNNVTSVNEYSTIVTVQQLGDRIMHFMHISRLKYNS